jgi:hypothetical protein
MTDFSKSDFCLTLGMSVALKKDYYYTLLFPHRFDDKDNVCCELLCCKTVQPTTDQYFIVTILFRKEIVFIHQTTRCHNP